MPTLFTSNTAGADLLGYWTFDDAAGSATALDYSGNANHGAITGATYTADAGGATGSAGDRAMDFGTNANVYNVQIGNAATGAFDSVTTNNAATISLWVNGALSNPHQNTNFGFYDNSNARQLQAHLPWSNSTIYWDVAGGVSGGVHRIQKTESDPTKWEGGWNHYVFTKSGTSSKIYQNGALWHSGTTSASIGSITKAFIGTGVAGGNPYAGQIDDFAIWDEELSSGDINAIFTGAMTPGNWAKASNQVVLADNPLAYWRLDETSGPTLADASGNNNNMTAGGTVIFAQPGATADGNASLGYSSSSSTSVASTVTGLRENFSVEFWINPDSTSNYNQSLTAGSDSGWGQFRFHTGSSGQVWVGVGSNDSTGRFSASDLGAGTVTLNEWQHFVFTLEDIDGSTGTAKFYKDGVLLASKVINLGTAWTDFRLVGGGNGLNGEIDDVAIYDFALTADQIGAHYAAASIIPEPSSLALLGLGTVFISRRRRV